MRVVLFSTSARAQRMHKHVSALRAARLLRCTRRRYSPPCYRLRHCFTTSQHHLSPATWRLPRIWKTGQTSCCVGMALVSARNNEKA